MMSALLVNVPNACQFAAYLFCPQDDKQLKELQEEKTKLEMELKNLESSIRSVKCVGVCLESV